MGNKVFFINSWKLTPELGELILIEYIYLIYIINRRELSGQRLVVKQWMTLFHNQNCFNEFKVLNKALLCFKVKINIFIYFVWEILTSRKRKRSEHDFPCGVTGFPAEVGIRRNFSPLIQIFFQIKLLIFL